MIRHDDLTRQETDDVRQALGLPIERRVALSRVPEAILMRVEQLADGEILRRPIRSRYSDATVTAELVLTLEGLRRVIEGGAELGLGRG